MKVAKKPNVIITDFDRTLMYLYRDTSLLQELATRIQNHYSKFMEIPAEFHSGEHDGYLVWHSLHKNVAQMQLSKADEINQIAERIVTDFEIETIKKVKMFDGVKHTTMAIKNHGIRLGIVSSNAEKAIRFAIDQSEMNGIFEYIGGRPAPFDPDLIKPNSYPLVTAIKEMQISNTETVWYVGDDPVDMMSAKATNIFGVGVCTGRHSKEQLTKAGADICLDLFNDIEDLL